MYETVHTFAYEVEGASGTRFRARVEGRQREDGSWEAWLLFDPVGGGPTLRTDRESTQPNRRDLEYWASGVEPVYLEGALRRAHVD
jgi:hypothetical protein